MSTRGKSRRSFLIESTAGLSGAWVAANYAGILSAEKYVLKAAQSGTNGIVPDSGNALTIDSRDESNAVSTPW